MQEYTGKLTDIIFRNSQNGYTVGVFETETEYFTVVGTFQSCTKGSRYKITGAFKQHPTYGEQFSAVSAEELMPSDEESIEVFLASGAIRGIGPKTARLIVSKFGDKSLDVIEKEPNRLLDISGIGEKKLAQIVESFSAQREFADVAVKFQEIGVSQERAFKLYRAYGADAVDIIMENPYRLMEEVSGFGFIKADNIAMSIGISSDSPFRIRSAVRYVLSNALNEGSTYIPQDELCQSVAELIDVSMETVSEIMIEMAFDGIVKIDTLEGQTVVYLYEFYEAEQIVCRNLLALERASLKTLSADIDSMIKMSEAQSSIVLSEQQKYAVRSSLISGVSVITGGPGTGKTTIINTIIDIFRSSGMSVAISAPTGRAAKRITQTSGYPASTVHRMLEYSYDADCESSVFGKNAEDPLDFDVVIVDESSMIDIMLMKHLTNAVKPGTRLILVGDYDQLPSVGAGNVLRDIIESELIHTVKLKEIFRQAGESMIVVNAHRINSGEYPSLNEKNTDFFFMGRPDETSIATLITDLVTRRLPAYYEDTDPVKDIQILTPVRKGKLGTWTLNRQLQETLNPHKSGLPEQKFGDRIFRVGDKVMQIRNNYELEWKRSDNYQTGHGVFNGDVGYISNINHDDHSITVFYDDDKYAKYDFTQADELELAYAVTVHKSQGSEFPVIVMPISWFPPMLATRNLLYTAVTRGKKIVVLVGLEKCLEAMVDNNRIKRRYSGLRARLSAVLIEGYE